MFSWLLNVVPKIIQDHVHPEVASDTISIGTWIAIIALVFSLFQMVWQYFGVIVALKRKS